MIGRLAARNLWRSPTRSALSAAAAAAAVFVVVTGDATIGGLGESTVRGEIDARSSHVRVAANGEGWLPQAARPAVEGAVVTARIVRPTRLAARGRTAQVVLRGVETTDALVFPRTGWKVTGDGIPGDGVLLSDRTARALGVELGQTVSVRARTVDGAENALRLPVRGTYTSGNQALDGLTAFASLEATAQLFGAAERTTEFAVRLSDPSTADDVARSLSDRTSGATASSWRTETRELLGLQAVRERALGLLVAVLAVMSAAGVANTMGMSVSERTTEIGTLRALGMRRSSTVAVLVAEGVVLGLGGGAVGLAAAFAVCLYGAGPGYDLTPLLQRAGGSLPVVSVLHLPLRPWVWALAVAGSGGVGALAGLPAAVRGASVPPAAALRGMS